MSSSRMVACWSVLLLFFVIAEVDGIGRPSLGVIRWDAWNVFNGQYDPIAYYLHRALTPEHFHHRIPFYGTVFSPTNISFNGDLQNVMDQEILYANHAGIDYWAFDTYCTFGPNCSTNNTYCTQYYQQTSNLYCPRNPAYGLDLYLNSPYKFLMNFTLVLLGSSPCDVTFQEQYIQLMKRPQFQTVMGGRPLLYLFQFSDAEADICGGGWSGSGKVFDKFRQTVIAAGELTGTQALSSISPLHALSSLSPRTPKSLHGSDGFRHIHGAIACGFARI